VRRPIRLFRWGRGRPSCSSRLLFFAEACCASANAPGHPLSQLVCRVPRRGRSASKSLIQRGSHRALDQGVAGNPDAWGAACPGRRTNSQAQPLSREPGGAVESSLTSHSYSSRRGWDAVRPALRPAPALAQAVSERPAKQVVARRRLLAVQRGAGRVEGAIWSALRPARSCVDRCRLGRRRRAPAGPDAVRR